MSTGAVVSATSGRLKIGVLFLTLLIVLCVGGSWMAADPTAIVDPRNASLLPPLSHRFIITLNDGSTLAAEAIRQEDDRLVMLREGADEVLPVSGVHSLNERRYWLGTDTLGRDVLARVLNGGRVSLAVGGLSLLVALVLGIGVGLISGWWGGVVDSVLMRIVDGLLAVPMLFLLLLLAAIFRPSTTTLVVVLGFSSWMGVARLVRGQVLSLKEREFVLAAQVIGASPLRIAVVHLLPNTLTPLGQDAVLRLGDLILAEASLSFLGLGVQPPTPSWGNMVAEGESLLANAWWLTFIPGAAVAITVIGAALLADGLRELSRADT